MRWIHSSVEKKIASPQFNTFAYRNTLLLRGTSVLSMRLWTLSYPCWSTFALVLIVEIIQQQTDDNNNERSSVKGARQVGSGWEWDDGEKETRKLGQLGLKRTMCKKSKVLLNWKALQDNWKEKIQKDVWRCDGYSAMCGMYKAAKYIIVLQLRIFLIGPLWIEYRDGRYG